MPEKSSLEKKEKIISSTAVQRKTASRTRLVDLFIKEDVDSVDSHCTELVFQNCNMLENNIITRKLQQHIKDQCLLV